MACWTFSAACLGNQLLQISEMKIYVVSLRHSSRRRASIEKQLRPLGLRFNFFDAVDGRKLTSDQLAKWTHSEEIQRHPKWLNLGTIGCALSHAFLYRKIAEENPEGAVILEDDMHVSDDFREFLNYITITPDIINSNTVILFYYRSFEPIQLSIENSFKVKKELSLLYPVSVSTNFLLSTGGYYISNLAAKSLSDFLFPIRLGPDCWSEFLRSRALTTILCAYPRPLRDGHFRSDIDYVQSYHGNFASAISKAIDYLRVPVIYNFLKSRRRKNEMEMSHVQLESKPTSLPRLK